ncbi:MAG: GTP-binding protein [Thermoplasmata archaeon]|nr:GTP-binding protein [Thermoplasmata archaeon]
MGSKEVIIKKIVLLGDSGVGKTSLIRRFVKNQFDDNYISTIGARVTKKVVNAAFDNKEVEVKLMIWDIIGSKGYQSTQAKHIAGSDGAILMVDLTNSGSLDSLEKYWIPLLKEVTGGILPSMLFTGNKKDLISPEEEKVMIQLFKELEEKYCDDLKSRVGGGYGGSILTSAKTGEHVNDGFEFLALSMLAANPYLDPLHRQIGVAKAKSIYESDERATTRSVMDLIVIELPHLVKSTTKATEILEMCIARLGFSKELPKPKDVRNFVDCVLFHASKEGATQENIEEFRKKWLEPLTKMG